MNPSEETRAPAKRRLRPENVEPVNYPILPKRVFVNIKRDMTDAISKVVFDHEVAILREIHGTDAVVKLRARDHNVTITQLRDPIDAEQEFGRLCTVYGRHAKMDMANAEVVYGKNLASFIAAAGGQVKPKGANASGEKVAAGE